MFPQLQVLSIVPWNSWYILSVTEGVFVATDLQIVKIITQNLTLLKSDTTTIYNHLVLNLNRKKEDVFGKHHGPVGSPRVKRSNSQGQPTEKKNAPFDGGESVFSSSSA